MSKEEKKAIEQLKKVRWNSLAIVVKNEDGKMDISYFTEKHKKTIINLIEKQQKELDKKDKIINEMSKYIRACDIDEDICKTETECISDNLKCENCIIDYFINKVDKEGR